MRTPWELTLLQGTKKCCVRLATAILQADNDYDHVRIGMNMISVDSFTLHFFRHLPPFVMFINIRRQVNDSMEADRDTEERIFESPGLAGRQSQR
jgi:hypothetical protein